MKTAPEARSSHRPASMPLKTFSNMYYHISTNFCKDIVIVNAAVVAVDVKVTPAFFIAKEEVSYFN